MDPIDAESDVPCLSMDPSDAQSDAPSMSCIYPASDDAPALSMDHSDALSDVPSLPWVYPILHLTTRPLCPWIHPMFYLTGKHLTNARARHTLIVLLFLIKAFINAIHSENRFICTSFDSIRMKILNTDLRIRYSITQFENSRAGSNKSLSTAATLGISHPCREKRRGRSSYR